MSKVFVEQGDPRMQVNQLNNTYVVNEFAIPIDNTAFASKALPAGAKDSARIRLNPDTNTPEIEDVTTSSWKNVSQLALDTVGYKTKRCAFATGLTTPAISLGTETEAQQRILLKIPVTSKRWRFRIRNWNPVNGTSYTGAIAFTGLWLGTPEYYTAVNILGRPDGAFASAPTQVLTAFTTSADGSEFISDWITDPTKQLNAYKDLLISYGFTKAAGSIARGQSFYIFSSSSVGSSTTAGSAAIPAGMASTIDTCYFHQCVEYEWTGAEKVGLALGDSLTSGVGQNTANNVVSPVVAGNSPINIWAHAYALIHGTPMMVQAYAGYQASQMQDNTQPIYSAWGLGSTIKPDFSFIFILSNDIAGLQTINSTAPYIKQIIINMRAIAIPKTFFLTIPPRISLQGANPIPYGTLTSASSVGATSIFTSVPFKASSKIYISESNSDGELCQVLADSTGSSSPYTTTLVSAMVNAHTVGETVFSYQETIRRQTNNYLMEKPSGMDGCIEISRALSYTDPFVIEKQYLSLSDNVHITERGHCVIAQILPSV